MKATLIFILSFAFCLVKSQSLVGTWQVTRQSNCLENEVTDTVRLDENMLKDFSSKSNRSPKIVSFNVDNSGEERIQEIDKKRAISTKKFHYKHDETNIYILDKKSHLIMNSLVIDKLTSDSLVYHAAGKECERTFLVRTK